MQNKKLVLASRSPRRQDLLRQCGIDFIVEPSDIEENMDLSLPLDKRMMALAKNKALPILARYPHDLILGADSVVVLDGEVMGKAANRLQAREFLYKLSGNVHEVCTACCLLSNEKEVSFFETSKVYFYPLSKEEIEKYLDSGEWEDKAGAYAIQGLGCRFVKKIDGDYNNIVGLPVSRLYHELVKF